MFALLCIVTGLTVALTAVYAYVRSRDALHPAIITALPFGMMLSVWPLILNNSEGLELFFNGEQLAYVQTIYLLTIMCFSAGLLRYWPANTRTSTGLGAAVELTDSGRKRLYTLAIILGMVSLSAYLHMIENVGGFAEAYSRVKGGGRAESGYIGEAILFSFPAVLAMAISRKVAGGSVRFKDAALAIVCMLPHLIQGTFGGRRGPLFLSLITLFFAWVMARGRPVSFAKAVMAIGVAMLSVLFVWSQRQAVYAGSEGSVELSRMADMVSPETLTSGDTYVFGAATILAADYYHSYYWGYRYFVTIFVRPIPRQLWPTKYEDMGAIWILRLGDEEEAIRLTEALGFETPGGSAMPSIADAYEEFSWGVLPFFFLLGLLFSKVWCLHRERGGQWTIVSLIMLALSVYLATQSVTAWAHRLLFISLPTVWLWKHWISEPEPQRRRPQRYSPSRPSPAFGLVPVSRPTVPGETEEGAS